VKGKKNSHDDKGDKSYCPSEERVPCPNNKKQELDQSNPSGPKLNNGCQKGKKKKAAYDRVIKMRLRVQTGVKTAQLKKCLRWANTALRNTKKKDLEKRTSGGTLQ